MSIYINSFLDGSNSICREERQFSLYLYNVLTACKKIKIDSEGLANKNYEVVRAYYEASFMRDYFNNAKSKSDFNRKLVDFANRKLKELYNDAKYEVIAVSEFEAKGVSNNMIYDINTDINSDNISFDLAKHINGWSSESERVYRNPIAKWMMNVKPDIGLLLKRRGIKRDEYKLHFIECKYMSGIDVYPALVGFSGDDGKISECKKLILTQIEVQELVLEFLCDELGLAFDDENNVSICKSFVSIAYFLGAGNEKRIYEDGVELDEKHMISLQKLYDYNNVPEGKKVKETRTMLGKMIEITF